MIRPSFLLNAAAMAMTALLFQTSIASASSAGNADFQDAQQLYESMTPAQKAAVMKQAQAYSEALAKMSPQERQAVLDQAAEVASTLDIKKVDSSKLNTKKIPSLKANQKALKEYQKEYKEGGPDHPVVRR